MTADLHELAAAYALDSLDPEEALLFEQHLPSCSTCPGEVEEFRKVATSLAETTATAPPADLKNRVLAEISETPQLTPDNPSATTTPLDRKRSLQPAFVMAAALLVIGGIAATLFLPSSGETSVDEVAGSLDAVRTVLDPAIDGQTGQLEVVWSNDRSQVAVLGSELADLGPDRAYALWFLLDDGVAPAGLFQAHDGSVSAVIDIDDLAHNGWGITIEPATGSDQPTTDVIFAGSI